jgi:hypothetical protein
MTCPVLDHRFDTPSYEENASGYMLTRDTKTRRHDGTIHGFLNLFPILDAGKVALDEISVALSGAFEAAQP